MSNSSHYRITRRPDLLKHRQLKSIKILGATSLFVAAFFLLAWALLWMAFG